MKVYTSLQLVMSNTEIDLSIFLPKRLDQRETTTKKSRIFVNLTGDLCRFKNINDSNIAGDFTEKIEF